MKIFVQGLAMWFRTASAAISQLHEKNGTGPSEPKPFNLITSWREL